jgi:hypothetical protein
MYATIPASKVPTPRPRSWQSSGSRFCQIYRSPTHVPSGSQTATTAVPPCWRRGRTGPVTICVGSPRTACSSENRLPRRGHPSWHGERFDCKDPSTHPTPHASWEGKEQTGHRVDKQDLLWETARLRTPEQFERGTDVVACTRNPLFLARDLAGRLRQPWESERRESTPQQVRRCMSRIIVPMGTPARVCCPRGYSPGWCAGRSRTPVARHPVVYKASPKPSKGTKRHHTR